MKHSLLDYIRCPITCRPLKIDSVSEKEGDEIISGRLCAVEGENSYFYSIDHGVPNLLEPVDKSNSKQTLHVFGNEWEHYSYWGWLDSVPEHMSELDVTGGLLSDATRMFHHKAQFSNCMLKEGSIAMDVGCGNGRHSFQALQAGHSNTISVDASDAIYVARRNFINKDITHTHFVRGNALNLPFVNNCVDHTFSIGVMQHTGNPHSFLSEQKRVTKPEGSISLNCYGTGTLVYEVVDRLLRLITTRLSISQQKWFAYQMACLGKWVWKGKDTGVKRFLADNLSVQPTDHHMFDWYSPKIADHYSPSFLLDLFSILSLSPISANYEIWRSEYSDKKRKQKHHAFCFHLKNKKIKE